METSEQSLNEGRTEQQLLNGILPRTLKQKILNLRCELPVPEKCCHCLPLRHGFLVLAYIKLVLSLALFLYIFYCVFLMYLIFSRKEMFIQIVPWLALCIDMLDIFIGITIIVSAYKKNIRLMEIYYRYSIYVLGLLTVLCSVIFHIIVGEIYPLLTFLLLFILTMMMQMYLILMVRAEVLKLRSNAQFQFLNNEPDPICTYTYNASN